MRRARITLIWVFLATTIAVPIIAAAYSPLLAWREPIYIAAGFAGIMAIALMLIQPLLVGGYLPGLSVLRYRQIHRSVGLALVTLVAIHVAALWITSPPDVVDALLFRSPTPFSIWGVIAMWATFIAALLAVLRRLLRLRPDIWRIIHTGFAAVIVVGSVVHAMLIEGTMETLSKTVLCLLVLTATIKTFVGLRIWVIRIRRGS